MLHNEWKGILISRYERLNLDWGIIDIVALQEYIQYIQSYYYVCNPPL